MNFLRKLFSRGSRSESYNKKESLVSTPLSHTISSKAEISSQPIFEYSLLQLSSPIFNNVSSSSDDDKFVKQAYSLMQKTMWDEARIIIQNSMETCNRKDRLCELRANIYLNQKNPLAIGWYMQSCILGSPSWVSYLLVSYAARAIGLDDIAWRCLNACDVISTKRIDKLEKDITEIVNKSDRSELVTAMNNFEHIMDPYLPSTDELPHDQNQRDVFLLQNLRSDPEMPPLKQRSRLLKRNLMEAEINTRIVNKKCSICGEIVESNRLICPKCGSGVFDSEKIHKDKTQNEPHTKVNSVEVKDSYGNTLTIEKQRALYLPETVLQVLTFNPTGVLLEDSYVSLKPEIAQWAIIYARRIALARKFFSDGNIKKALKEFLSILEEIPDAAIVLNDVGVCFSEMGDIEQAKTYLNRSLQFVPAEYRQEIVNNLLKIEHK